jgi:hypothetical protein
MTVAVHARSPRADRGTIAETHWDGLSVGRDTPTGFGAKIRRQVQMGLGAALLCD